MKLFPLVLFVPFTFSAQAFTINNVHKLSSSPGVVYRGSQPLSKYTELTEAGITDVLIFKNEVKNEVTTEMANLKEEKIKVTHIPMEWKDIKDLTAACKMTVKALKKVIEVSQTEGRAIYFHCTAGEDRTGMLAGLFRISTQGWTASRAYKDEMCKNGFAEGNPAKVGMVATQIRKNILPIFAVLSAGIADGQEVNDSLCTGIDVKAAQKEFPSCAN